MKCRLRLLLFPALWSLLLTYGCGAAFSPKFDVAFSSPKGEPVFIEKTVYDDAWIGHCGIIACCWKTAGKVNVINPYPVPKKVYIRWFNYRQQKFYEAKVDLPENTSKIIRDLPKPHFGDSIITTGVKPDGEVVVWVSNGLSERTGIWIEVARAKGKQVPGNPDKYRNTTAEMRENGEI